MTAAALVLGCDSCGATSEVAPELRTTTCPYCGSPQVIEKPPSEDRPRPTFALGFVVPRAAAVETAREWRRRHRTWAPRAFARAPVHDIRGVYLPVWLYSAVARSRWAARIGEEYTVRTKDGTSTRTEWHALQGDWAGYVKERVVSASRGVPNEELEAVEPFELGALHRYAGKVVSGWITEDPSRPREECLELARREAREEVAARIAAFLPGDEQSDVRCATHLEQEDLVLTLLPVWLLPIRHHPAKPPVRVLVNGQTGRVHGRPPVSWKKVLLAVGGGLAAAAAIAFGIFLAVAG